MENIQDNYNDLNNVAGLEAIENPNLDTARTNSIRRHFAENYPPDFLKKKPLNMKQSYRGNSAVKEASILIDRMVIAEVIATYLLVFVTCGSASLSVSDEHKVSRLGASVAGGLIVTVMIYAVGHISGAHMNPAVTLAFAAIRHFPWNQVPFYAAAQLTGATCAGFTLRILLQPIKHVGTTSPSGTDVQALVMEIVVTFSMMFITSAVATDTKAIGELAGIAVGSAVCITSILAGPISGGSMNPARTIGPAIASNYYKGIWVYALGPVCGTLLGSWSYSYIRVSDKPLCALTQHSSSFKLRRKRSNDDNPATDNNLNHF